MSRNAFIFPYTQSTQFGYSNVVQVAPRPRYSYLPMRLSHDVWHQIIQYLEYERGDSDAPEKRITLLTLALTSRSLSSLALTTLWKNMDSMEPIVDVINSFTPDQEDPFLTWIDDGNDEKYWVRISITAALSWLTWEFKTGVLGKTSRRSC